MSYRKSDYKDLTKWQETKRRGKAKYYRATQGYPRRAWTCDEDEMVLKRVQTDRELSAVLKRSIQSIQTRRYRLTLASEEQK